MKLKGELVFLAVIFLIQHYCFAGKIPENSTAIIEKSERSTSMTRSVSASRHNLTVSKGNSETRSSERNVGFEEKILEGDISGSSIRNATREKLEGNINERNISGRVAEGRLEGNTGSEGNININIGKPEGSVSIGEPEISVTTEIAQSTEIPDGNITTRVSEGGISNQDSKIPNATMTTEPTLNSTTNPEDVVILSSNLTTNRASPSGIKSRPRPIDNGPIILRPKQATTVEPILIPLPNSQDTCCFCGGTRICGKSAILRCSGCRRSLNENHNQKLIPPNDMPKLPSTGSEVLPANGEKSEPQFEAVQADVNLSRKEILQRRLNFQRTQEFMRSIEPKVSIQGNTANLKSDEPIITLNGKAVEIPKQSETPNANAPPPTFTEKIKWFFGFGEEDKTKPQQVRSPLEAPGSIPPQLSQNPVHNPSTNNTTGILNCPLSKLQRLKQLKATVGL